MKWSLLFFLITLQVKAYDAYEPRGQRKPVCDPSYLELQNLPPLRDQGAIGICYSFSSLLLLEHLKCSKAGDPQECYRQSRASAVDLTKFYKGKEYNQISVGGEPEKLLRNFSKTRSAANDACTYFDAWARLPYSQPFEDFFHQMQTDLSSGFDDSMLTCHAEDMARQNMGNVQELLNLMNAGRNLTVEELRSKFLYKKNCQEPNISFPAYDIHRYPAYGSLANNDGILKFVKGNLEQQRPVEVSFCAEKNSNGQCYYHSTTIIGMRNVCDTTGCNVQYRLQNSYGKTWQDNHDDGWVNSKLINQSIISTSQLSLTSISPKGTKPNTQNSYQQHQKIPFKVAAQTSLSSQNRFGSSQCYVELPDIGQ